MIYSPSSHPRCTFYDGFMHFILLQNLDHYYCYYKAWKSQDIFFFLTIYFQNMMHDGIRLALWRGCSVGQSCSLIPDVCMHSQVTTVWVFGPIGSVSIHLQSLHLVTCLLTWRFSLSVQVQVKFLQSFTYTFCTFNSLHFKHLHFCLVVHMNYTI